MFATVAAFFEVMDKEPTVWLILLSSLSTAAIGMLMARRRPILCVPFISLTVLGAFAIYLELRDSYVRDAILSEGGSTYVSALVSAIFAGIGMPLLGAFVGARKLERSMSLWRWTLGASGAVILGLTIFVASGFVKVAYYVYILVPREKAGEGYTMPLRWQDIVTELSITCVLIGLFLLSVYLLRSALRQKATGALKMSVNS